MLVYTMFNRIQKYDFNYRLPAFADGGKHTEITIDDLKHMSPFFTEVSPFTYAVLLEANKDKYTVEEKQKTQQLIHFLTQKENETMKAVATHLKTREEYERTMTVIEAKLDELESQKNQSSSSVDSSSSS